MNSFILRNIRLRLIGAFRNYFRLKDVFTYFIKKKNHTEMRRKLINAIIYKESQKQHYMYI